jgi:hypothetical protein
MTAAADRLSVTLSDRYRIDRELGQGGMATVYLAEDLKHKRKVALKVLPGPWRRVVRYPAPDTVLTPVGTPSTRS